MTDRVTDQGNHQDKIRFTNISSISRIFDPVLGLVLLTLAPQVSKLVLAELSVRLGLTSTVSVTTLLKGELLPVFFVSNLFSSSISTFFFFLLFGPSLIPSASFRLGGDVLEK